QGVAERGELAPGLVDRGRGVTVPDDAGTCVQRRVILAKLGASERDRPLPVAVGIHPADRTRVRTAIERLQLPDRLSRRISRLSGDRRRGVQRLDQLERAR